MTWTMSVSNMHCHAQQFKTGQCSSEQMLQLEVKITESLLMYVAGIQVKIWRILT